MPRWPRISLTIYPVMTDQGRPICGSLTPDEVERLGETFMLLEQRMEELKETFGLEDEDLNLDLGPLGQLM